MNITLFVSIALLSCVTACGNHSKADSPEPGVLGKEEVTAYHFLQETGVCIASSIENESLDFKAGPCPKEITLKGERQKIIVYCPAYKAGDTQRAQSIIYEKMLLDSGVLVKPHNSMIGALCDDPNA